MCQSESDKMSESSGITRKRQSLGRMVDVAKKLKVSSHSLGPDCRCKRLKCFEKVNLTQRNLIIKKFNQLATHDEQSAYLCGLITCSPVKRHRNRQPEEDALFHLYSYSYKVRVTDPSIIEIQVCYKAFMSIHGITPKRVQNLQTSLKTTGSAPTDRRGKHENRPHKLSEDKHEMIMAHIRSFKGRKSHYSLSKTSKTYLPEELNIKKMFSMFKHENPNVDVSYEKYRKIFNTKFNIAFGYPRTDTCSYCDSMQVKIDHLNKKGAKKTTLETVSLKKLEALKELHLRKAMTFYSRKRAAKYVAQGAETKEAIVMDFQKNLPVPNISTNDVYYRRQLSFYMFNIHCLSDAKSFFFTYPETAGRKGADDVASMLFYFLFNELDAAVNEITLFCDSCGGQNKNWTVFRFLHYIVHFTKRLQKITVIFPIRGHSYLECDKNMGLINQKSIVEVPEQWNSIIRSSRVKPSPFEVIPCDKQQIFREWSKLLDQLYLPKCPFPSRPVRQLVIVNSHPRFIMHKSTYNGPLLENIVLAPRKKRLNLPNNQFKIPDFKYGKLIPLKKKKYEDIQHLKQFCSTEAQRYFSRLPHMS